MVSCRPTSRAAGFPSRSAARLTRGDALRRCSRHGIDRDLIKGIRTGLRRERQGGVRAALGTERKAIRGHGAGHAQECGCAQPTRSAWRARGRLDGRSKAYVEAMNGMDGKQGPLEMA